MFRIIEIRKKLTRAKVDGAKHHHSDSCRDCLVNESSIDEEHASSSSTESSMYDVRPSSMFTKASQRQPAAKNLSIQSGIHANQGTKIAYSMVWIIGVIVGRPTISKESQSPLMVQSSDDDATDVATADGRARSPPFRLNQKEKGKLEGKIFPQQPENVLRIIVDNVASLADNDMPPSAYDFLSKKCNRLLRENSSLQLECDRLQKENLQMKKSTIRMFVECLFSNGLFDEQSS